ncbi:MAG: helix-turn-helix domain-containing protein [Magnetococcales bacterium]|nr:helix-turn-helix domain-containing protein [Magnetococcales bacterium]NGZ25640.1 helix-turn-helix domain-containing protein [Magnetococcales bacterium]
MMKLSDRIQTSRKNAGFTQKELADRVGISQTAIHKLECGRSRSSRRTVAIAIACGIDPIWLETGRGDMISGMVNTSFRSENMRVGEPDDSPYLLPPRSSRAPLVSWEQAAVWLDREDVNAFDHSEVESWVPLTRRVSKQAFALRVSGDSMENEFSEGDIIIVDPSVAPEHKRFVIACTEEGRTTFKQLMLDGGQKYLKPLNPRYPLIEVTSAIKIIGVVVSKYKEY